MATEPSWSRRQSIVLAGGHHARYRRQGNGVQVAVPGLGLGGIPRSTGRGIGGTESLASTCRDASFTSAMPPCRLTC